MKDYGIGRCVHRETERGEEDGDLVEPLKTQAQ